MIIQIQITPEKHNLTEQVASHEKMFQQQTCKF